MFSEVLFVGFLRFSDVCCVGFLRFSDGLL